MTRVGGEGVCRETTSKARHLDGARRPVCAGLQKQFLVRARNASGRRHSRVTAPTATNIPLVRNSLDRS